MEILIIIIIRIIVSIVIRILGILRVHFAVHNAVHTAVHAAVVACNALQAKQRSSTFIACVFECDMQNTGQYVTLIFAHTCKDTYPNKKILYPCATIFYSK